MEVRVTCKVMLFFEHLWKGSMSPSTFVRGQALGPGILLEVEAEELCKQDVPAVAHCLSGPRLAPRQRLPVLPVRTELHISFVHEELRNPNSGDFHFLWANHNLSGPLISQFQNNGWEWA